MSSPADSHASLSMVPQPPNLQDMLEAVSIEAKRARQMWEDEGAQNTLGLSVSRPPVPAATHVTGGKKPPVAMALMPAGIVPAKQNAKSAAAQVKKSVVAMPQVPMAILPRKTQLQSPSPPPVRNLSSSRDFLIEPRSRSTTPRLSFKESRATASDKVAPPPAALEPESPHEERCEDVEPSPVPCSDGEPPVTVSVSLPFVVILAQVGEKLGEVRLDPTAVTGDIVTAVMALPAFRTLGTPRRQSIRVRRHPGGTSMKPLEPLGRAAHPDVGFGLLYVDLKTKLFSNYAVIKEVKHELRARYPLVVGCSKPSPQVYARHFGAVRELCGDPGFFRRMHRVTVLDGQARFLRFPEFERALLRFNPFARAVLSEHRERLAVIAHTLDPAVPFAAPPPCPWVPYMAMPAPHWADLKMDGDQGIRVHPASVWECRPGL
ncbi:hypothetical protein J8273_5970 [Carpediemonas membranifera]|uniref:Uncharacterized protein n=1 Tax=Carpediemonas membranifera TaxID=201153 RepID=A0A8J6B9E1_9EUKA|nr:hypothetical protein J8273_5970 [Carpediemonas membranifera]|eukprot:KAG9392712.1 hypothetical protein J8273_5970 [Carpediemonas membranifera]